MQMFMIILLIDAVILGIITVIASDMNRLIKYINSCFSKIDSLGDGNKKPSSSSGSNHGKMMTLKEAEKTVNENENDYMISLSSKAKEYVDKNGCDGYNELEKVLNKVRRDIDKGIITNKVVSNKWIDIVDGKLKLVETPEIYKKALESELSDGNDEDETTTEFKLPQHIVDKIDEMEQSDLEDLYNRLTKLDKDISDINNDIDGDDAKAELRDIMKDIGVFDEETDDIDTRTIKDIFNDYTYDNDDEDGD